MGRLVGGRRARFNPIFWAGHDGGGTYMGGEHLMKARLGHPPSLLPVDAQLLFSTDLLTSAAGHLSL